MSLPHVHRPAPRTAVLATYNSARRSLMMLLAAAMTLFAMQAFAHHGWAWAEDEQSELKGSIAEISMAPPHPSLRVKADDGQLWQVDLGNPNQTRRSGFTGDTAKVGDAITVLGNRTREPNKPHIKAVRITIDGKHYDMYPERIKE